VEVPGDWNGVLLLVARAVPVGEDDPPWQPDEPLLGHLVSSGYAVAGVAHTIFWPLERSFTDQPHLLDIACSLLGPPRHTIAFGLSIGGIMSAGAVQLFPDRLSGALALGANLAGAIANHNSELDIAFVVKTLLAADTPLQVARITDPFANLGLAKAVLHEAQGTPAGRARLGLAAAVGNMPGWHDATSPEPSRDDHQRRQENQFTWFDEVCFLVFFFLRWQVELQAGGNPSWNTDVDYHELLATSVNLDEVEALYGSAFTNLADDLERLASAPRIGADEAGVAYLTRHIVLDGNLSGVPVVTVHTDGDGLVTPDQSRAYGDVVNAAGDEDLLRQLYVHRGGHCTFTFAEIRTALDLLIHRIERSSWPEVAPESLNRAAGLLDAGAHVLPSGEPLEPRFFPFAPPPLLRRFDTRDL
jgi:hypothetical protein